MQPPGSPRPPNAMLPNILRRRAACSTDRPEVPLPQSPISPLASHVRASPPSAISFRTGLARRRSNVLKRNSHELLAIRSKYRNIQNDKKYKAIQKELKNMVALTGIEPVFQP